MGYSVRPYQPGDEEGIVELLELVFNGWPHFDLECTPLDHWTWKYLDNPIGNKVISICMNNDKIIGCFHSIPRLTKIGSRILMSGHGADVAVHPDYRRLGIQNSMNIIVDNLRKKIDTNILYIETGSQILFKRYLKMYPRFPYKIIRLFKMQDIDLHMRMMPVKYGWLMKHGFYLISLFNKFKNCFWSITFSGQNFSISKIDSFDERVDEFWDRIRSSYDFIVVRDHRYLNWRYCDKRGGNYIIKIAEENKQILGYIVLRINKYNEEYPIGYIIDLLTIQNRLDVVDSLLKHAIEFFHNNNINVILYRIIKNHSYEKIAKKYGFINDPSKIVNFYKLFEINEEDFFKFRLSNADKIHFVLGDYDI